MDDRPISTPSSPPAIDDHAPNGISDNLFRPSERNCSPSSINFTDERWLTILDAPCTFPPEIFLDVMLNLVKNPNVTSSQLFRADIFYDSNSDRTTSEDAEGNLTNNSLTKHMKAEYQPIRVTLPDFILDRTIVRNLVPRNSQRDRALVQTCHFFHRLRRDGRKDTLTLYIPHITVGSDMPFYHPAVQQLAFHHSWTTGNDDTALGLISIHFQLFPTQNLTTRLSRTALKLLQTVHKHGQGLLAGYEKRVHLDQIIPQKRFQDTYARLKAKYGKQLASQWVEVTDPGKHVFEDLGIAAFLIELWRDMYASDANISEPHDGKPRFPGFVDIGCGNGVLTYILLAEGYAGQGFDARERKTWTIFPASVREGLKRRLLVPEILQSGNSPQPVHSEGGDHSSESVTQPLWHHGVFPKGTFIISNHADELTAWTPMLAYLNASPFIAIPCCSHDFSGSRFRAPVLKSPSTMISSEQSVSLVHEDKRTTQAAETGSLRARNSISPAPSQSSSISESTTTRPLNSSNETHVQTTKPNTKEKKTMPSAYSTLCSYVTKLTEEVGFVAETEMLRIPSTRNMCIVGRRYHRSLSTGKRLSEVVESRDRNQSTAESGKMDMDMDDEEERKETVRKIVEREMKRDIDVVGREWIARATRLGNKPGSGH